MAPKRTARQIYGDIKANVEQYHVGRTTNEAFGARQLQLWREAEARRRVKAFLLELVTGRTV